MAIQGQVLRSEKHFIFLFVFLNRNDENQQLPGRLEESLEKPGHVTPALSGKQESSEFSRQNASWIFSLLSPY